jgi:flagellar basal-body rod protein FlgB
MIDGKLFPHLEKMLDWTAQRQQALSANIANIDTPGYRAKDVAFSEQLGEAQLTTYEVPAKAKDNGNTVDLDREMTELSKNGLQYVALVQYLNQKLRTLRTSLTEGGRV